MNPRDHALAVIKESLEKDPQFLIALQYLGMLKDDALLPIKESSPIVERIETIPPEIHYLRPPDSFQEVYDRQTKPEPYIPRQPSVESMAMRYRGERISRDNKSPIHPQTGRTLFSMWVEKQIPWSPAVMGWDEDDPRVDAMYRETGG